MKSKKTDKTGGALLPPTGGLPHRKNIDLEAYKIAREKYAIFELLDRHGPFEDVYDSILTLLERDRREQAEDESRIRDKEAQPQ